MHPQWTSAQSWVFPCVMINFTVLLEWTERDCIWLKIRTSLGDFQALDSGTSLFAWPIIVVVGTYLSAPVFCLDNHYWCPGKTPTVIPPGTKDFKNSPFLLPCVWKLYNTWCVGLAWLWSHETFTICGRISALKNYKAKSTGNRFVLPWIWKAVTGEGYNKKERWVCRNDMRRARAGRREGNKP